MAIGMGAALLGSAVIGGGLSVMGASKSASASKKAAAQSAAVQREQYAQNSANLNPFMRRGNQAGGAINALLGLGGDPTEQQRAFNVFRNSSGFQFRQQEGENALNSGYAARGLINSGAAQKAFAKYNQNLASDEFGNYMGYLGNQQGVGLSGASALAGVGQNFANSMTNINTNRANSQVANTNALMGNLGSSFGTGLGALSSFGQQPNAYGITGSGNIY